MNKIKFSNEYDKMMYNAEGIIPKRAILMETFIKEAEELHPRFIEYDTSFVDKHGQLCQYKLPNGKNIILLLKSYIHDTMMIWTTIRRYTPQKYEYYSKLRGEEFDIKILEE